MRVLFFAWCREQLGVDALELPLTQAISVGELKQRLAQRGESWQQVFASTSLLCAVNQHMVNSEQMLNDSDEVAFFPPVTGG